MPTVLSVSGSPSATSRTARLLRHLDTRLTAEGHRVVELDVRALSAQALLGADFGHPDCLLSGSTPPFSYSAEGAEMGKLMVAEGLGAAVLPDYSVHGDPLERSGTITCRPLADDNTEFRVMLQQRHAHTTRTAAHDLHSTLVRQAERRRANLPTRRKEQR